MKKIFHYSKEEVSKLLVTHGLSELPFELKLEKILSGNDESQLVLALDLAYHPNQELIQSLLEHVKNDTQHVRRAALVLGIAQASEAIPYLVSKLQDGKSRWDIGYVYEALSEFEPQLVVPEVKQQIVSNSNLSSAKAELLLKQLYRRSDETVSNKTRDEICEILFKIAHISQLSAGYLISWQEISHIENILHSARNKAHINATLGTLTTFDATYAELRQLTQRGTITNIRDTFRPSISTIDKLIFGLGVVEHYKDKPEGIAYDADYEGIGYRLWENTRKQLRDAICGNSEAYKDEREKLKTITENALIVLIPMIMSALNIAPQAAGVAVVLALMVLKIGIKTLCTTEGDLNKLRGRPREICKSSGRYANIRDGLIKDIHKGSRFPNASSDSEWIFIDELPQK